MDQLGVANKMPPRACDESLFISGMPQLLFMLEKTKRQMGKSGIDSSGVAKC